MSDSIVTPPRAMTGPERWEAFLAHHRADLALARLRGEWLGRQRTPRPPPPHARQLMEVHHALADTQERALRQPWIAPPTSEET